MNRREALAGLAAAAACPGVAHAQPLPSGRLGVLFVFGEDHPTVPTYLGAIKDTLRKAGWSEGRNLQLDIRFGASDPARIRRHTEDILALKPDVVFAQGVVGAAAMQRATRTVPVVFVQVQDPVGGGFVTNLARPEANLTGFTNFEYAIVGKWLQLLKEVAPNVTRAVAIINPDNRPRWDGYAAALERYGPGLGLRAQAAGVHDATEVERTLASIAAEPNCGLVVLPDATTAVHAGLIIGLAARHRIPAVYSYGFYARQGGLIAYSDNVLDQFRGAAAYIDRLLRGARIADLPVQATDRFETVVNLQTARALGLTIPPSLLANADEVIE